MAKTFSLKSYEEALVISKADLKYLKSAAYKKRCQRADAELPAALKKKLSVLQKQLIQIKKIDFGAIRTFIKKDSAEILESMRHYAEGEKWILPKSIDELAGFYFWLLNDEKIDVGEYEDNRKIIKLFHEYILKTDQDADNKKQVQKNENKTWKDLVKIEFHDRVERIENEIHEKVTRWKSGKAIRGNQIECAAYCRLLFDKKYFYDESKLVAIPVQYASMKFNIDIKNQLASSKKLEVRKHKLRFEKHFK